MISLARGIAAMLGFALLAAVARTSSDAPYLHPQRLVDVGGRRVNLYCTGSGSPTVVLDTDGDDTTSAWRFVQPAIARTTRVCSYDPPGFGFSDPLDKAQADADGNALALHAMLRNAGIAGPIVLVGYSVSGLYDRVFADRYPSEVAGMVLVSPNVPYQDQQLVRVAPGIGADIAMDGVLHGCLDAAQRHAIVPGSRAYARCVYTPPDPTMPAPLLAMIRKQWQSARLWRSFAVSSSDETERGSSREVVAEQRSYGAMPLVVLTTTKDALALPIPGAQKTALVHAWIAWHRRIAAYSSVGKDIIVAGSSSSIPIDRPSAVVAAIEEIVRKVRR